MQSVESAMVNLIIPLSKDNGIAKKNKKTNVHSNIFLAFLLTLEMVNNCLYERIFCCSIYQCSLEGANCSSLNAIAQSKVFIWSFWVYHLKFSRFTSTLVVHNFRGISFVFWYASVHL